ncbi:LCP family protein [Brevibacillus sp. H7]|uniref:LCP family protein n=1 Tax=Brevibacillus sp. H7 TaxID=3349138 RepID=UPI003820D8DF
MLFSFLRSRWKPLLLYGGTALALALAAAAGYTAYQYKRMTQDWYAPLEGEEQARVQEIPPSNTAVPEQLGLLQKPKPLKPFLLLLIGIDSRDGERARSDTMMLAAVHPEKQRAYLISIPRDSFMELPGRGYDKVNHAMAFGGPKLVKNSLERFLNVKIDRYVTIDFDGFRKIVDELGGVEIHVKKRMKYTDPGDDTYIDLQPGLQRLNGKQALDYARYRKSDLGREDSDYERIVRQQEIVKALANKGDSVEAFFKAFKLMDIMGKHVKTDLTEAEIASLLITYYDPKQNHLETETLKGADERIWRHGIRGWYYLVPSQERSRVHGKLLTELAR